MLTLSLPSGKSEVLIPESITLDKSNQKVIFQLKFKESVDKGTIEISKKQ